MKLVIVYQAGLANLFQVDSFGGPNEKPFNRNANVRRHQGAFETVENMARGAMLAGAEIRVASCNRAGDIAFVKWVKGLSDCPFRDNANPPKSKP